MRAAFIAIVICLLFPTAGSADVGGDADLGLTLASRVGSNRRIYVGAGLRRAENYDDARGGFESHDLGFVGFGVIRPEFRIDLAMGIARSDTSEGTHSEFYESYGFTFGGDRTRFRLRDTIALARAGALEYRAVVAGYHDLELRLGRGEGARLWLGLHAEHFDWKLRAGPELSAALGGSPVWRMSAALLVPLAGALPDYGGRLTLSIDFE